MERCKRCNGSKKATYLGGIYVTCKACNGVGYINAEKEEKAPTLEIEHKIDNLQDMPIVKKRGRQKGWKKPEGNIMTSDNPSS